VIEFDDLPVLTDPVMIAAFEGWNDAGEAASSTITHLREVWQAEIITELDSEEYYDYQVNRPHIGVDESGIRQLEWPGTRIYLARIPLFPHDVVLVQGIEPNMKWQQFTREILGLAAELDVAMVITVAALLSDSPHTRPVPVTGSTSHARLAADFHLEPATYEGPTGIVGVLQEACDRFGIPALSLWAAIPHYVGQPPCPKGTLALVRKIEDIMDVPIPLGELVEESRAWEIGVDELAEDDEEVADYVRQLEQARDTTELPEATGEAIAQEFERYLRRRGTT